MQVHGIPNRVKDLLFPFRRHMLVRRLIQGGCGIDGCYLKEVFSAAFHARHLRLGLMH